MSWPRLVPPARYSDRLWINMPIGERAALAASVGELFSLRKMDTEAIAYDFGYPEATIYSALNEWREGVHRERFEQA